VNKNGCVAPFTLMPPKTERVAGEPSKPVKDTAEKRIVRVKVFMGEVRTKFNHAMDALRCPMNARQANLRYLVLTLIAKAGMRSSVSKLQGKADLPVPGR
jgi:hypothetical protein